MSSFGERSLKLIHDESGPTVEIERELEREALKRERNYDLSRKRNRTRATRRAGNLLQSGVNGRRGAS